jgi:alpha-glucosidase
MLATQSSRPGRSDQVTLETPEHTSEPWWADAVGYQVYISSFADADGNGLGDVPGLTSRLDHLVELGVTALWITPFFPSPQHDNGYDVSDYLDCDPRFGTLADVEELIAAAHERGIRIIFDLVVNHSSSEHAWFLEARSSRENPYRDYYIWRDPAADGGPPNNWAAHFGGDAWTLDQTTGQYYLHLFLPEQPDLNWDNPKVADEVDAVIRFWLDRGVDGLRIDTAQLFAKDPALRDNPPAVPDDLHEPTGVSSGWAAQQHLHDMDQPHNLDVFRRWRTITAPRGALVVGEVFILDVPKVLRYVEGDGLDMSFWFEPVTLDWEPDLIIAGIREAALASGGHPKFGWVLSSHDSHRGVSRYGDGDIGRERTLALHTIMFALPGTPFLYQGEELALEDGLVPVEALQDPAAVRTGDPARGRDCARTPMPWDDGPGMGFTTSPTTWLPFGGRTREDTVAFQRAQPGSWFHRYRQLVALRRTTPALRSGPLSWDDPSSTLVSFARGDSALVVANLADVAQAYAVPDGWALAYSSTVAPLGTAGTIPPRTTLVLTAP